ncbi:hypothetical protein glysoja_049847 [Glycine soja]|uniref:Uncharacterized protein n=1 Tax=Glycine soja TaxID=3848 RepID=A0A0B2SPT5_GLYSO|nr:hypothetical protein glysoja_049847 [Glycine soja]
MAPPSWVASPPEQFHIQLPCGAASLPLPFGTGHETEHYNPIFSMSFLEHRVGFALKFEKNILLVLFSELHSVYQI